ncbi:hypothetical protein J3Q64DRAFT_1747560 [Phycomyces blakesleeanus]|uniref:Zn(2)-C6 fungal-type domain-containing protein n=1 Tax=Phycomyces blakesleeanus TaxID=4837 RepID=A0ABR3AZL2_PHYBL
MPLQSKLAFKSPDSLKYKSVPKIENANHVVHTINTSSKMLMWICKSWEEYPENTAAITKHSRVKNACEGCHKQKIKCEDIKPCTRCKNKKLTCEINVPPGSTNNPLSFITSSNDMNLPVDGDPRSPTPDKSPQIVFSSPLRLSTAIKQNLVHTTHGVAPQKPNISANDKRHLLKVYFNRRDPFYPMFSLNYLEDQLKKCENNERSFLSLFFFYALFSRASIFCTQRLQALEEQLLDYAIYLKSLYITTIDPSNMLALVILANHKSHRQLDNDFALVKTLSKEAVEHTKLLIEHYYEQNGTFPPSYYEQYKRSIWWVFIMDRVLHIEQEESFSLEECKVPVDLPEKDIEIDNYYDDDNDVDHTNIMDQWLEGFRFIIIMTKALGRGVNFYRTWIIKKEVTSNYNPYIYTLDNWILTEYLSLKYNPPHLKCIFKDKATTAKLSSTDSTSQTSTSLEGLTENDGLNLIYFLVGFLVLHQPYTVSQYGIGEDISKVSKRGCKAASAMIIKVAIWMGQDSFSSISRSPIVMFALFSSLQLLAQFGIDKDHDKPQSTHSVFDNGLNFATNLPLTTSSKRLQTKLEDIYGMRYTRY